MTPSFSGRMAVTEPGVRPSLRFVPHGQYLVPLDGYDGGLAQDDALVLDVDQRIGCAQVNANVIGEQFDNFLKER